MLNVTSCNLVLIARCVYMWSNNIKYQKQWQENVIKFTLLCGFYGEKAEALSNFTMGRIFFVECEFEGLV